MLLYVSVLKELITSSTSVNGRQCCCTQIQRHLAVTSHRSIHKWQLDLRKPDCDHGREMHHTIYTDSTLWAARPHTSRYKDKDFSPLWQPVLLTVPTGEAVLARSQLHLTVSLRPNQGGNLNTPSHPTAHRKAEWKKVRSPLTSLYLVSLYSGESQTSPGGYTEIQGKSSLGF